MTNATVAKVGTAGNGRTLQLAYAGGEQTIVVPDGVPVVTTEWGNRSSLSAGEHVIVTVGRLVPNKRIDELLRTFACYQRTCVPEARLAIVGSGDGFESYAAACRRLAGDLGLADPFAGRLDDAALDALLRRATAYLACSEHEGFCVPLVEAMRRGLPIVARDFGAVAETLGGAGIAAPREAGPAELAELLHLAVTDAELGAALAAGRAERLAALDPTVIGGRLLELLGGIA